MKKAIIVLIVLAGCIGPNSEENTNSGYFDFHGLMESQLKQIQKTADGLNKWAIIGKDTAANYVAPDSAAWRNELGILLDIDLNQPRLKGLYSVSDSTDGASNLKIKVFRAIDNEVEIATMLVYYLDEIEQPYRALIESGNANPIFQDMKRIDVWFEPINGAARLDSIYMEGFQKRVFSDTVIFVLASKIKY